MSKQGMYMLVNLATAKVRPQLEAGGKPIHPVFGPNKSIQQLHLHQQQWMAPGRINHVITTSTPGSIPRLWARISYFAYHLVHSLRHPTTTLIANPQSPEVNHACST